MARKRKVRKKAKGTIVFYNPRTKTWYRARRTRKGLRILGKARR